MEQCGGAVGAFVATYVLATVIRHGPLQRPPGMRWIPAGEFSMGSDDAAVVDPELRVIKVSIRGLEKYHPSDSNIRIKTGCTVVAVERGDELVVEFGADFRFEPKDSVYICGSAEAAQKYYEIFPQD